MGEAVPVQKTLSSRGLQAGRNPQPAAVRTPQGSRTLQAPRNPAPTLARNLQRNPPRIPQPARKVPVQTRSGAAGIFSQPLPGEQEEVGELRQCRRCRRTFASDRIAKHQSVCKGPVNEVPKPHPVVSSMNRPPPKKEQRGVPEWKKQHIDFINNVRYAKRMTLVQRKGGDIRSLEPPPTQLADPTANYIQCPHCKRKYNQQAAERHIPRCKDIINKPKPPPKAAGARVKCRLCGNTIAQAGMKCPRCKR